MRIALERRAERRRRQERLDFILNKIKADSQKLQIVATEIAQDLKNRNYNAATLINAVARGFLGRIIGAEMRLQKWAALKVQCGYRRHMAKKRSGEEKWRKVRVAPSRYALNLMRLRSKITSQRDDWIELFDTNTNTFWYLNKKTAHSTWTPPAIFEQDLFCRWDPWPHPYESISDSNQPCRTLFKTMAAFQKHRLDCHCWICPACDYKNVALSFPKCTVCFNSLDRETGHDLTLTLEKKLQEAFNEFKKPPVEIVKVIPKGPSSLIKPRDDDDDDDDDDDTNDDVSGITFKKSMLTSDEFDKDIQNINHPSKSKTKISFHQNVAQGKEESSNVIPVGHCDVGDPILKNDNLKTPAIDRPDGRGGARGGGGDEVEGINEAMTCTAPEGGFPDRLSKTGMATSKTPNNQSQGVGLGATSSSGEALLTDNSTMTGTSSSISTTQQQLNTVNGDVVEDTFSIENMRVCSKFLAGQCTATSCPQAHPGIRDASKAFAKGKGRNKKYYVKLCEHAMNHSNWSEDCDLKLTCKGYHPYIRPSTMDIIRRLYPIKKGRALKIFPSGAQIDGNKCENDEGVSSFNGYGIMTWSNGDVYQGDWLNGMRHGIGIFKSHEGREYAGEWFKGSRHGWGCLDHANGDTFEGEFHHGVVEGVGRLTSPNGDVYTGQFMKNKFHGLGKFRKGNGDEYLGYCHEGKAHGLGVLALANGEKYKGSFVNDKRSGKGVSVSKSGARYVGGWLNGLHQGYGVFVSRFGERYVGQWERGLKHGKGRYVFNGGDFYDGDFVKNKAQGKGVYFYAASGNVYAGPFVDDKKCGYGIYAWRSGSRYEGCFKDNSIHGKGFFDFANGASYRGEFVKNKKEGKGIYVWKTGNKYRGDFHLDKLCGIGEMQYVTMGHRYLGEWKDNKKHGEGTFWYSDGNIYKGEFQNDCKHGYGLLRYKPDTLLEERYEGMFDRGVRHGHGIYLYKKQDGLKYEGNWHRGLRHGFGTMIWPDGKFYRGNFIRERQTGRGLMVYNDGSQYEGEWKDNEKHGEGSELSANGCIHQGRFVHDKKHGPGLLTYIDGNHYHGEWEDDHIKGVGTYNFHPSNDEGEKVIKLKVFGF
mmetsp:Transcript_1275/g.1638  ORF Transcript_1275/g.1638 Transcript_1275/m.1638 type:complete len:1093 (+) Transcript_1275:69-3347(+)